MESIGSLRLGKQTFLIISGTTYGLVFAACFFEAFRHAVLHWAYRESDTWLGIAFVTAGIVSAFTFVAAAS